MLKTWLTQRFQLDVPVVSAPMAGAAGGALAAAVSAAGALGTVGWAAGPPEALRAELETAAAAGKAYGVGLLAWLLDGDRERLVDTVVDAAPPLVSISYGEYARHVERLKAAGSVVVTQCGTVDDAREAVDAGVDAVVARGGEGGGHGRDVVATLPLLQAVLDAVDVPVLAAGGIATARGVAAVLAAGAAGAWVGTAFLPCTESAYDDNARRVVLDAGLGDTVSTTVLDIGRGSPWPSQWPGRAVRNSYADTWHGREDELRANPVRSDEPAVWAGQAAGLVREQRSAAEVVAELAQAETLLRAWCD